MCVGRREEEEGEELLLRWLVVGAVAVVGREGGEEEVGEEEEGEMTPGEGWELWIFVSVKSEAFHCSEEGGGWERSEKGWGGLGEGEEQELLLLCSVVAGVGRVGGEEGEGEVEVVQVPRVVVEEAELQKKGEGEQMPSLGVAGGLRGQ